MILTCPNCSTKYQFPGDDIPPEGQKVKCTKCGEVWEEFPDPDELIESLEKGLEEQGIDEIHDDDSSYSEGLEKTDDGEDSVDVTFSEALDAATDNETEPSSDIPESVKPNHTAKSDVKKEAKPSILTKNPVMNARAAVALIFIVSLSLLLLQRDALFQSKPETAAFYNLVALAPHVPGQGVEFDRVNASFNEQTGEVRVSGLLLNMREKAVKLPALVASFRDAGGVEVSHAFIQPPVSSLNGLETIPFNAVLEHVEQMDSLRLSFNVGKIEAHSEVHNDVHDKPHYEQSHDDHSKEADDHSSHSDDHSSHDKDAHHQNTSYQDSHEKEQHDDGHHGDGHH